MKRKRFLSKYINNCIEYRICKIKQFYESLKKFNARYTSKLGIKLTKDLDVNEKFLLWRRTVSHINKL